MLGITAYEGTTTLLPSDVVGDPEPTITWSKNKKKLPGNDSRFLVVGDGALQIENIQTSDAGMYVCFAGNEMGADERKVKLVVKKRQVEHNQWQSPSTLIDHVTNDCSTVLCNLLDTANGSTNDPMQHMNSGLHAIAIGEFPDYVATMHDNENAGFENVFKVLFMQCLETTVSNFYIICNSAVSCQGWERVTSHRL